MVVLFLLMIVLLILFGVLHHKDLRERHSGHRLDLHWHHAMQPVPVILGKAALLLSSISIVHISTPILK